MAASHSLILLTICNAFHSFGKRYEDLPTSSWFLYFKKTLLFILIYIYWCYLTFSDIWLAVVYSLNFTGYRLGISTISKIVRDVCQAIWVSRNECIMYPKKSTGKIFLNNLNRYLIFLIASAVDGKHIRIVNPCNSMYYNYKGFSSIVLKAVSDSNCRFIYVDIGSYGKDGHSTIFKECSLWKSMLSNKFINI